MTKRNEQKARLDRISAALATECAAVCGAIRAGAVVNLPTFNGRKVVGWVALETSGLRVHCPKDNGGFGMSYYIANDSRWDDLCRQAGVARTPVN